jgi:hypothetical protein
MDDELIAVSGEDIRRLLYLFSLTYSARIENSTVRIASVE